MKTPLEQLISKLEISKDTSKTESFGDIKSKIYINCIELAKSLLQEERKVIEDAWKDGRNQYYFTQKTGEQYFETKFNKDGKE